jgi:hypothetical protein
VGPRTSVCLTGPAEDLAGTEFENHLLVILVSQMIYHSLHSFQFSLYQPWLLERSFGATGSQKRFHCEFLQDNPMPLGSTRYHPPSWFCLVLLSTGKYTRVFISELWSRPQIQNPQWGPPSNGSSKPNLPKRAPPFPKALQITTVQTASPKPGSSDISAHSPWKFGVTHYTCSQKTVPNFRKSLS